MKEPFIFLCSEISRENAVTLIKWLKDEEVRRYLSDSQSVSNDIEQVVNRVNLPILTHLFNQNGRFYMAYNKQNVPVGFVRLIKKGDAYEIIIRNSLAVILSTTYLIGILTGQLILKSL